MDCCAKANMSSFSRDENVSKAFFPPAPSATLESRPGLGRWTNRHLDERIEHDPSELYFSGIVFHTYTHRHVQETITAPFPFPISQPFRAEWISPLHTKAAAEKVTLLYFALLHNKSECWCTRRRRYSLLFSTLLPKISFSRRKLFNYCFSVVAGFKDAFSLLLFCLQTHFCVTSLPNLLLHLWPLGLCTESAAVILCEMGGECIQNIPELFCFDSVDGAVDWLGWVDLGYKAPFVGRSSSLIRSADMFRMRSRLKDTRWHLLLCPGVWCTWPLRQWSFIINHSQCLETLKPELEETW